MDKLKKFISTRGGDLLYIAALVLFVIVLVTSWFGGKGVDINSKEQRRSDMFQR